MPAFTTDQWAIMLLVLLLGWLLGLLSRFSGARWRRVYERERADNVAARSASDARIAAADARIAELERAAPVRVGGGIVVAADRRDDLSLIRSIDQTREVRLNEAGINGYRDISRMTAADESALEARLGMEPGAILRERWRDQADMLAAGRLDDHRRTFA